MGLECSPNTRAGKRRRTDTAGPLQLSQAGFAPPAPTNTLLGPSVSADSDENATATWTHNQLYGKAFSLSPSLFLPKIMK